jgi:hypothetical protein
MDEDGPTSKHAVCRIAIEVDLSRGDESSWVGRKRKAGIALCSSAARQAGYYLSRSVALLRILLPTDHPFSSETDHPFSPETDQCSPVKSISVLR